MHVSNRTILTVAGAVVICFTILLAFRGIFSDKNNPNFSYGKGNSRNHVIHVIDKIKVEVPFVFEIGQEILEVSLSFSGEHARMPGFKLSETPVAVRKGKVASKVIIHFGSKPSLRAGTHFLTVIARDTGTGKIVSSGKIRIAYNMHEVIAKCSC